MYQMELPFNTVYSQDILGQQIEHPVADWPTKRAWIDYAYDEFLAAGYAISSDVYAGARPLEGQFQLSRQPVARQRPAGHRRGQLRPYLGHALSKPARVAAPGRRSRRGDSPCRAACSTPHQMLVRRARSCN